MIMAKAPAFWSKDGLVPRILSPLSAIGATMTARRVARPGWRAPVPVVCCGNVTVGGAGKTTVVLDLARRLRARGVDVHILLRGYGGSSRSTHRVHHTDPFQLVGDEALLLADVAPTWIGADRAASAKAAVAAGARLLLMDDGLQNPTLEKTLSFLVIDGSTGFGNGRILPAGPLREPLAKACSRVQAAVLIGADRVAATRALPAGLAVLRANLRQDQAIQAIAGRRVLAFAGIAVPDKFFAPLQQSGALVAATRAFPDHHPYTARDLSALVRESADLGASLVTTPKDAVRLPADIRAMVTVIGVDLAWENPQQIDDILQKMIDAAPLAVA